MSSIELTSSSCSLSTSTSVVKSRCTASVRSGPSPIKSNNNNTNKSSHHIRGSNCSSTITSRHVHWSPFLVKFLRTSEHFGNLNLLIGRMAKLFYSHGRFCASHPWEVMVTFLSLAICMFTMGPYVLLDHQQQQQQQHQQASSPLHHHPHSHPHQHPSPSQPNSPPSSHNSHHNHHSSQPSQAQSNVYLQLQYRHQQHLANLSPDSFKHAANSVSDDLIASTSQRSNSYLPPDLGYPTDRHTHQPPYCTQSGYCSNQKKTYSSRNGSNNNVESSEVVILTISRCLALLYVYHQFRKLYKFGSKYLVGIAGLFTVFSSFIFCSGVVNFLNGNLSALNKAIPFFILLSDFSKASLLAQFALSSSSRDEIHGNIARGMATLGPSLTLDTLVETLAIGMGTISGLPRLEEISYFACMTILVNYVVFMTFFPAALALALELSHDREGIDAPVWQFASFAKVLQLETEHTPNPVIQRVKLVMSAGLMLVHTLSRWPTVADENPDILLNTFKSSSGSSVGNLDGSPSNDGSFLGTLTNRFISSTGTEQFIMIGLVCVLAVKYIFFENKDIYNMDYAQNSPYSKLKFGNKNKSSTSLKSAKRLLSNNKDDADSSESCSNTSSSSPNSTRPTTPTTSSTGDELDATHLLAKPETPSILITAQDSDTESVIAECRRKSHMLLSSVSSSNSSSRSGSVKGLCVIHRNHHHHATSSGHGSATDNESTSLPTSISECEDQSQTHPSFFIGDDCSSECYSSSDTTSEYVDREVQTDMMLFNEDHKNRDCSSALTDDEELQLYGLEPDNLQEEETSIRDMNTLLQLLSHEDGCNQMSDREVQFLVEKQHIPAYKLESVLGNSQRGVAIRRRVIEASALRLGVLKQLPYLGYEYDTVLGACCENVIGYLPLPLGVAGPLHMNGRKYFVPMATTEGCLVASTNRGCRAVALSGGLRSKVYADGMTRGPVLHFRSAMDAASAMDWLNKPNNFELVKSAFDSTSRFARLQRIHARVASRYLYLRFVAFTGDAMGMNMLSKGTEMGLEELSKHVSGLEKKCLSGNFCTDKKPSSVNWIEGRGKSVVCETVVPCSIVEKVLKTSVEALVELNISKNLIGSSIAGSIGGNNAQAANIVAAIFIATGQDPAQTVGSSNCLTIMEAFGQDLYISCTMPSIEIGTIGGGTVLGPQSACLELLGLKGCSAIKPGSNSCELAQVVCGTVLAAELSLLSALAAGHLVRSHMKHNRSNININLEATPANFLGSNRQPIQPHQHQAQ